MHVVEMYKITIAETNKKGDGVGTIHVQLHSLYI